MLKLRFRLFTAFRAITDFLLVFYSARRVDVTRFVSEWSAGFATNYLRAAFERSFPQGRAAQRSEPSNQTVAYAVMTIQLIIYFSENPHKT
jgi:hypothetical protein